MAYKCDGFSGQRILRLGYPHERLAGEAYDELADEFIEAAREVFPRALVQFEDFLTPNVYRLLNTYRDRTLCFNDDIQGTAAVTLAGLYAGARAAEVPFNQMRFAFLGAGSAATGIADLVLAALVETGLSQSEARQRIAFVDEHGLLVAGRDDLQPHNRDYALDRPKASFKQALEDHRPHALIGATGAPGTFAQEIIETMAAINERPLIFALSNPTSRAECTAEQAYAWSNGRAFFASGSPFDPVVHNGVEHRPGQGNNACIFPGIGLGAIAGGLTRLPEAIFLEAAKTLADAVSEEDLTMGAIYPPLTQIRAVSRDIGLGVMRRAAELGLTNSPADDAKSMEKRINELIYLPSYESF